MTAHTIHEQHDHEHGPGCGHTAVRHAGHVDYLHDGHLHHPHDDHVDEHSIAVDGEHPLGCTDAADDDPAGHVHRPDCGHDPVPHDDHTDYLVNGRLHHPHEDHCDDHGPLTLA
jgi:hypothetical protein